MNLSFPHVLLIDDNDTDNLIGKRIIEISGFSSKIDVSNSAVKALAMLEQSEYSAELLPDVIFLDINMPIIDGFQFLDKFAQMGPTLRSKTKVVILSSSDSEKDIERIAGNPHVIKFITKPLKPSDLEEIKKKLSSANS